MPKIMYDNTVHLPKGTYEEHVQFSLDLLKELTEKSPPTKIMTWGWALTEYQDTTASVRFYVRDNDRFSFAYWFKNHYRMRDLVSCIITIAVLWTIVHFFH